MSYWKTLYDNFENFRKMTFFCQIENQNCLCADKKIDFFEIFFHSISYNWWERRLVSNFGTISFNLTLLFKKNLGKLLIFLKKALQKEVTFFSARIELAEFFFPDSPTYVELKNEIKKRSVISRFRDKKSKRLKNVFFSLF